MVFVLLVACLPDSGSDSAQVSGLDVDMAPRFAEATFDRSELDCTSNDLFLHDFSEDLPSVTIWNYGPEAVRLSVPNQATPGDDHSWVTATFADGRGEMIESGASTTVDLLAIGHCANGETIQSGEHSFELTVAIDEVRFAITANVLVDSD